MKVRQAGVCGRRLWETLGGDDGIQAVGFGHQALLGFRIQSLGLERWPDKITAHLAQE